MKDANAKQAGWKHRLREELISYSINFVYLAIFFGVFTWYRRLVLDEYRIPYLHYGFSVIQALILAKVIMLGDILRLGKELEAKPLIYPTVYNTVIFTIWVAVFEVIEHTLIGLAHGKGLAGGIDEVLHEGKYAIIARSIIVFFAFVPFFAFRQLTRVMGKGKLFKLFFLATRV